MITNNHITMHKIARAISPRAAPTGYDRRSVPIANRNTLTYVLINLRALKRIH
jgi:hypothetical protein